MTERRAWLIDVYGTLVSIDVVALWSDVALSPGCRPPTSGKALMRMPTG